MYADTVFGFMGTPFLLLLLLLLLLLSWMSKYDYLDTCCFERLICVCFVFLYCTCSAPLSMFHMERRSRNTFIIIIIITTPRN